MSIEIIIGSNRRMNQLPESLSTIFMALVQLGGKAAAPSPDRRTTRAADYFFSIGVLAAILGTCWLGAYLWLSRTGQISVHVAYGSLRSVHALLQLYGFIGAFVIAFLLQAGPMVFGVKIRPRRGGGLLFLVFTSGLVLAALGYSIGSQLVSFCFFGAGWLLWPLLQGASAEVRYRVGMPCLVGLLGYGVTALGPIDLALYALLGFWSSIVPIAMAVAQQIMRNLFQGRTLQGMALQAVYGSWLVSTVFGWSYFWIESSFRWQCFAFAAVATVGLFVILTRAYRSPLTFEIYGIGFGIAWSWLFFGALVLSRGPEFADCTLHLWGAGFAMTLIFNVSSRVVGSVTNTNVFSDQTFLGLMALWQVVPVCRGLSGVFPSLLRFSWIVAIAALIVVLSWGGGLTLAILRFVRKKRYAQPAEAT